MFRYYFIDVIDSSEGDNIYSSAALTQEEMLDLVKILSKDYSEIDFCIKVSVVNYKEKLRWKN